MRTLGVIPVRMGSSRFPGKPLASIHGTPMVDWVVRATRDAGLDEVVVATCDEEIRLHCARHGTPCVMTSVSHQRASDRTAEAADIVESLNRSRYDVVVMVQGDEPMVTGQMIQRAISALEDSSVDVVNLAGRIATRDEFEDPNCVKVVCAEDGNALFFSRSPIPWGGLEQAGAYRQVCVIPFRRQALKEFVSMAPSRLEVEESIDMMRLLERGRPIRIVLTDEITFPVDTPADLARVERALSPSC